LTSSARFRDILQPLGIAWELRAVFCVGGVAWGACSIYRGPRDSDFTTADARLIASAVEIVGDGFRRSLLLHGLAMPTTVDGPGLVLLDRQG
jgi:hypothetical protein